MKWYSTDFTYLPTYMKDDVKLYFENIQEVVWQTSLDRPRLVLLSHPVLQMK